MNRPLVLVVEDHRDTADLYVVGLAERGFDAFASDNVAEAFEWSCARLPDAVITDLALPEVDGFELIRRLAGDSRTRRIPVIAISGYGRSWPRGDVVALGAWAFIPKPCTIDEVEARVREALSGSAPTRTR
jgi:two-component system, cell cycle response regulator DivK